MSAPPFTLFFTEEAQRVLDELGRPAHAVRLRKVKKSLRLLRDVGPQHPGLNSHKYQSLAGPHGEEVWESYVENQTPGTWRLCGSTAQTPTASPL